MRSTLALALALLWLAPLTAADQAANTCGQYGTTVEFFSTPSEAARQAKAHEKLVFVLHVSGLFEDPKFT